MLVSTVDSYLFTLKKVRDLGRGSGGEVALFTVDKPAAGYRAGQAFAVKVGVRASCL